MITPDFIIETVCEHFHVSEADLKGKKRNAEIVLPRQIAMYLCRTMTQSQFNEIGKYIGGRDHSTVMHGCKAIEHDLKTSENMRGLIDVLTKKINPS